MYAYKFKRISLENDGLKIKAVARFKDWVYDKFVPLSEILDILPHFVCYEKDFDSVMSKAEMSKSAIKTNDCWLSEQSLFDSIVDSMN